MLKINRMMLFSNLFMGCSSYMLSCSPVLSAGECVCDFVICITDMSILSVLRWIKVKASGQTAIRCPTFHITRTACCHQSSTSRAEIGRRCSVNLRHVWEGPFPCPRELWAAEHVSGAGVSCYSAGFNYWTVASCCCCCEPVNDVHTCRTTCTER